MNINDLPEILQTELENLKKSENFNTPIIFFSKELIISNIHNFCKNLDCQPDNIFFPVKSNNNTDILKTIKECKCNFEIASLGELELLKTINIKPADILFGSPVKIDQHIKYAYEFGIKNYAFDTESELNKISINAPNSNVYLRIIVANKGSEWSLTNKYGAKQKDAVKLFKLAEKLNLKTLGISFHVGWNNSNIGTWLSAIKNCDTIITNCIKNNINLQFVNIGGGFPAHNVNQYKCLEQISKIIKPYLNNFREKYNLKILAEPGSFIVTNSGVLVTKIYDIIKRNTKNWVFVDTGICQGFYWIYSKVDYNILQTNNLNLDDKKNKYIITGPTCDSHDIFKKNVILSDNLKKGDLLLVYPAGAYINSAKEYNGFSYPENFCI